MSFTLDPDQRWLNRLEKRLGWLAIPNLASFLVGLQIIGFLLVLSDPLWMARLALIPHLVLQGEVWRLITFLALPLSLNPFWMLFVLWFLYFIVDGLENAWGSFKATFYVLVAACLTIVFSLAFMVPITYIGDLEATLFLAAAALAPDYQILLFLVLPVKLAWLAWITVALIFWRFVTGGWLDRLYLIALFANYLIFFGPYHLRQVKQWHRRWQFRRQFRR
jgi:hypothetical protein